MESATFRKWLAEHGCRFDRHEHEKRGEGDVIVTVHREGRKAEVPLGGSHQILDARVVRRACEELGLDWSRLPGPEGSSSEATDTVSALKAHKTLEWAVNSTGRHSFRGRLKQEARKAMAITSLSKPEWESVLRPYFKRIGGDLLPLKALVFE